MNNVYCKIQAGVAWFHIPLSESGHVSAWFTTRHEEAEGSDSRNLPSLFAERFEEDGMSAANLAFLKQTHGNDIITVKSSTGGVLGEGDGLITGLGNVPLAIRVADCLSIQLYDPVSGAIGNLHCGWRSGAKNIITLALAKLIKKYGFHPESAKIVMMPSISQKNFQVGDDVYHAYADNIDGMKRFFIEDGAGKWLFDLRGMAMEMLKRGGIKEENIIDIDLCTYENENHFYSYRRDGAGTGRMTALIYKVK